MITIRYIIMTIKIHIKTTIIMITIITTIIKATIIMATIIMATIILILTIKRTIFFLLHRIFS